MAFVAYVRVVVSELHSGSAEPAFLAVTKDFASWIQAQPGCVSYEVIGVGHRWTDRMEWVDADAADAADHAFARTDFPAKFGGLVLRFLSAAGEPLDLAAL